MAPLVTYTILRQGQCLMDWYHLRSILVLSIANMMYFTNFEKWVIFISQLLKYIVPFWVWYVEIFATIFIAGTKLKHFSIAQKYIGHHTYLAVTQYSLAHKRSKAVLCQCIIYISPYGSSFLKIVWTVLLLVEMNRTIVVILVSTNLCMKDFMKDSAL